jgi:hypothetical protein
MKNPAGKKVDTKPWLRAYVPAHNLGRQFCVKGGGAEGE